MVLLWDNDILLKLAAFDLLEAVSLALEGEEIFVLDTARYRLRRQLEKPKRDTFSPKIIQAALNWCEAATPLTQAAPPEDEEALLSASYLNDRGQTCEIDGGELLLFSQAFRHPEARLLTGDKRALFALGSHRAKNERAKGIHAGLRGRVVCLEASIELCIAALGFEQVRAQIVPQRSCDIAMQIAFSSGLQTVETSAKAALDSYIRHEEKTLGADWLWRP